MPTKIGEARYKGDPCELDVMDVMDVMEPPEFDAFLGASFSV